ncbi:GIP, partial [Symbiodinium sp. KB8]
VWDLDLRVEERRGDRSQPVGHDASGPTPLDVLITGMTQLQQVLLKQKNETIDLEPKAVQELAKLPEYTPESGATDFQDYLYLAEQQIGSLSSSAGEWWQRTLRVAQKAYSEYQSLSPMKRLGVRVTLPDDLQDDRYKRLERKVASLMLSSLPKGVRDELVAHRVQGVHQILFRLMVVFQPGGAQDRAQLLKQLDITESSPGPAEAVTAIRRWYRLLQRAADLNIAPPDESLQVKSLSTIVKRTADMHSDFKFRVALARTELQIDSRPSQANVMRFLQHLLAELEQLGGCGNLSHETGASAIEGYCSGFVGHFIFDCYLGNSGGQGQSNKMDQTKMAEILSETNKMLKAITQQQTGEQPVPAPPQDPLALIQQQLDEVRRLKVMVVKEKELSTAAFSSAVSWYEARLSASRTSPTSEEEGEALLDSGASHAYRPVRSVEDASSARRVTVTLATGEERDLNQTNGGTLLGDQGSETIVPMGQLVKLLGCSISWSPSKLTVVHPVHGRLQVRLRGHCPVVPVSQAMTLIAELEQARMQEFEKTIADLKTQVKTLRDRGREDWSWERHLDSLVETGDRTSMAGFLHTCPVFEAISPEVLLGLPEAIPLGEKEGWKLMKGLPWSRAKRKSCFQSDGWVVHLCAGDPRTRDAKLQETMRKSMWSSSLVGGDVLVEVDIASSRSMDVLQQQAVFRVLAWAALNGKIKAVIGGPPRHGFPASTGEAVCSPQRLKELKIMVRMLALWYMAEAGRVKAWKAGVLKQPPVKPHVGFLLEHPAAQEGKESFFDLPVWKAFSEDQLMAEVLITMNGRPTILGGNLDLWDLRDGSVGALEAKDPGGSVWPLELVAHLAGVLRSWTGLRSRESLLAALTQRTINLEEPATLCKFNHGEWKLHLQRDHLPYRRDCRVCVERASGKPHRRVTHPTAYSMAVDLAGPFRNPGVGGYKYLMVGCYRFPRLAGLPKVEEHKEPEAPAVLPGDGEDWLGADGEEDIDLEVPVDKDEDKAAEMSELDKEVEALKELAEPLEFTSVYLARPMKTRKKKDALRAVQELYIQLRSNGLPLNRLHMDRAREFQTDALEAWAAGRDVEVTRTQGSDPAGNGTAERAVGAVKARVRVLLAQAKELSGASDEAIRTWWPFAAETAVAHHQAMAFGRRSPTVARFGSRVFTKRKGYGQGGRFDLLPRWLPAVYLGPARSVPGGHLVLTDEGNLWYTTNVRQFQDPPVEDEPEKEDVDFLHPPVRRIRRKSSIVELAGGVGLMPGLRGDREERADAAPGLRAISMLGRTPPGSSSSGDLMSDDVMLGRLNASSESTSKDGEPGPSEDRAARYLREGRFSMQDCLEVLEGERFRKTKKQRSLAWGAHDPPPVHTTLGAYQRGPWSGITTATQRHLSLTKYLVALLKHHCGEETSFTSMTVARNLCTDAHKDRFNLRSSRNLVVTVGNFEGGGIWQEGRCEGAPRVSVQMGESTFVEGYVQPVKDRVVQVDPKKLHKTMPWTGGPKWTVIAHTAGLHRKLEETHREELRTLGFVLPELSDMKAVECKNETIPEPQSDDDLRDPGWLLQPEEIEEEMWLRLWTRCVLDEEDVLSTVVPPNCAEEFVGVTEATQAAKEALDRRENRPHRERYDTVEWMSMCRLTEGSEEVHGVEGILELQTAPLKVVYTVALEEVKQFIDRWVPAITREADALIKAGALVPLSRDEQRSLEASGKLVILPAKGVFTVKPPDQEVLVDEKGVALPRGSPDFYKRKARLVICGNFQGKQAKEDSYAGGCQTDSLRAMLVHCAALKWSLASTDIRNAFILAPIMEEDDEDDTVYGLYPPKVLQLAKVQYALQLWRVDRALYGFRRSPRLWGRFRDKRLRGARIPFGDGHIYFSQHKADENIWSARAVGADGTERVVAYLNVYVDDLLYMGESGVIEVIHEWLTSEWKASPLTWADTSSTIRFLGLEISRTACGGVRLHQRGYIGELLRHHSLSEEKGYATPCPQEWLLGETDVAEEDYDEPLLRRAQGLTGELLWLSGKSRPDLMHTVATMSSLCLKCPSLVEKIGLRALGYLKHTINLDLVYEPTTTKHYVEGFSDASFAPNGSRSVGCCLARYLHQPISWRCGRQALVSLSVAEAELIEAISATQMAYGLASFTEELQGCAAEIVIKVDNSAAVGLSSDSAGTWKTRHLRVRAFHLREAVRLKELRIQHIPGEEQLGDLGTKCFHQPRLHQLLALWGLKGETARENVTTKGASPKINGTVAILAKLVVILGWMVQGSRASSVTQGSGLEISFPWELYLVAMLALVASIALWEGIKWLLEWISLTRSGTVSEARGARRLRRLQQAISEEVARYDFDEPVSTAVQTDPDVGYGYREFNGPFVMSEYG